MELETAVASAKQIARYVYNGQEDSNGNVVSCAENATLPNGKPIVVLCAKTIQATRDENGAQGFKAQTDGRPRTWRYNYNASGQLLKRTGPPDALGQTASTSNTYYGDTTATHFKGDLARTQNAVGDVTQFLEYTKDGLASKIKRSDGVIVNLEYGTKQSLISSMIQNGKGGTETTKYSYDDVGQLTRIIAPDGSTVTFGYDDAHRLTSLRDGAGNRVQLTPDDMGNVTRRELRNAAGNLVRTNTRSFDALNRLESIRHELISKTSYQYDRTGNMTGLKDSLGRISTSEFDNLDRMTKAILPPAGPGKLPTTIGYGYDHQDSLVIVTDPRKLTTRYTLDGHGQRRALSSPDTNAATYEFDDAGNLVSSRDGRGVTTGYRYDAAQRVTKIGETTFEYGKVGTSETGRLTVMNDESGKSIFSYDGYGRPQGQIQTVGNGAAAKQFVLSYKYGTAGSSTGHITSMTYPGGNRIEIAYGPEGKASSLTLISPNAATRTNILSNIGYAPWGAVQSWTWGNPASQNVYKREFDSAGRIRRYPLGRIGSNGVLRTLSYDDEDRIKSTVHTGTPNANTLNQNYEYDDLDRLIKVEGPNISQAFEYDANGNRIAARFGSRTYSNTIHTSSNRMTKTTGPVPAKTNTYDNAGNLANDGSAKYTYGSHGRLSTVELAGITTQYRYNGFGERVEKTGLGGNLTYYVYDLAGHLIGEYDRTGNVIQETVFLDDLPVAVLKPTGGSGTNQAAGTEVFGIYTDHILTPRVITRQSDNRMVWRWDNADPFGLQQPDESPNGLTKFIYNPRFPGQVYDKETNNHYNYFRDYDPQTGRYVQSDPIGLNGGINTYGYAGGNPTINIDPTGEVIQVAIGGGTSVAMGWAIAKLTGQCYSGNDVVLDAALGAAGVGIFNKARSIYRISKLRAIAKEDGMIMTATQKGVEKYVGEGTSIEIKSVGNILSPGGQLNNSGSWFPRARYKVAPGSPDGVPKSYLDPFSGKTGPLRSDAAHIPLEATIGEAAALGGGVGAAVNRQCGCN